jgi:phosphoglycerate dehydrogenase-like enzyme
MRVTEKSEREADLLVKVSFLKLSNFIGTPHVAGGSSVLTGEPGKTAVENLVRFLRGEAPQNVMDPFGVHLRLGDDSGLLLEPAVALLL